MGLPGVPLFLSIKQRTNYWIIAFEMIINEKLAFVFPGQGSQSVGMLRELAASHLIVKSIFSEASDALGLDLLELVQNGPEEELNRTENTQPALLTTSYCLWRAWEEACSDKPAFMAGHSLGEYTALVCAGVLNFSDAVKLVRDRGRYMQLAVPEGAGAMAAILGLEDSQINDVCEKAAGEQVVSAANFNSPGQTVIAGDSAAVERAIEVAKSEGAKRAILLPVSVPSHCALMEEAAEKLAERLSSVNFNDSRIPILQNVDAKAHSEAEDIKQSLIKQLHQPVRWVDTVQEINKKGISHIVECGPGKVLTGLIKRIDRGLITLPISNSDTLQTALGEVPWT